MEKACNDNLDFEELTRNDLYEPIVYFHSGTI